MVRLPQFGQTPTAVGVSTRGRPASVAYQGRSGQNPHVDSSGNDVSPRAIVRRCLGAHRAQDWDELRSLFHPKAKIGTFAGGGAPSDPEQAIADMKAAHADVLYRADVQRARELDHHAVILDGRVRYRLNDNKGFIDAERSWLYIVLDGRLYRSQMFLTSPQAEHAYTIHGLDLGVES